MWAPRCLPLFRPAGFQAYTTAWLTHDGQGGQGPRRQAPRPAPPPRWLARPARLSAPVGKTVRQRRGVGVQPRGVFGTIEAVTPGRRPRGWQLQTALVERRHLSLRHPVAAMGRRGTTLCKGEAGWRQPLGLFQGSHHFCLPPARVRLPLAAREATNGTGAATRWCLQTPAMAAGLTDPGWSWRDVLLCRVPPGPQPAGRCARSGGGPQHREVP